MEVNILEKKKDSKTEKKNKDKLPFAVFITPQKIDGETQDYKQIFTDIISDRIKQEYR